MEFGVLNGESIVDMYRQLRGIVSDVYGFDTFEGLPSVQNNEVDVNSVKLFPLTGNTGTFETLTVDEVHKFICLACRIPSEQLHLEKGLFSDTFRRVPTKTYKDKGMLLGAYIDCTLYSATKEVLDYISPLVQTGTWLFFDDFWTFRGSPLHGPQRAISEWLKENENIGIQEHLSFRGFGKAFIVYIKDENLESV